jgi:hypothetical protein
MNRRALQGHRSAKATRRKAIMACGHWASPEQPLCGNGEGVCVRRLVVLLVALLAAWLGVVNSAVATPRTAALVVTYTYDAHHDSTFVISNVAERARPTVFDDVGVALVVDSRSLRTAARSQLSRTVAGATTYDGPACSVSIDGSTIATVAGTSSVLGAPMTAAAGSVATKRVPCASFRADTLVAMADGTTKKISEVEVGDQVVATNPETGGTSIRTVTKLWTYIDDDLLDVVVLTDNGVETIHTTEHHRFWNDTTRTWVDAKDLRNGDRLRTTDGDIVTVGSLKTLPGSAPMLDLTADTDHTFYVALTATAVLVHNQTCDLDALSAAAAKPAGNGLTEAGRAAQNMASK